MLKQLFAAVLCLALVGPAPSAQSPEPPPGLARLQTGRAVTVETRQPGRKLKGQFVRADGEGITLRLKRGAAETIRIVDVRRVTAKRKVYRYTVPLGAAAGGALVGGLTARPSLDFVASDIAWLAAVGAGIGAAAGLLVGCLARTEVVYEAPLK